MPLSERIGIDLGGRRPVEESLAWAAASGVRHVDVCLDAPGSAPNAQARWTDERAAAVRATVEQHGIHLGLHTLSAVNVAETTDFLAEAVDRYLGAYIDLAPRLGARWIVVHGGFHFTSDYAARRAASVERLARVTERAERAGVRLLLENLNPEPEHAEVHYLACTVEECRAYFDRIGSPALGWAFTVNHAHLLPDGVQGFAEAIGLGRCGEVRLADNRGLYEEHLFPGEGTLDFGAMFRRLEAGGYRGHYMLAFGSREDMLRGRDVLAEIARASAAP